MLKYVYWSSGDTVSQNVFEFALCMLSFYIVVHCMISYFINELSKNEKIYDLQCVILFSECFAEFSIKGAAH
jgi:hypothetical protein